VNDTWLYLDCHNLLYRAFYAMGKLSHDGKSTGAVYGFLRDVQMLRQEFRTDRVAFCFDHGRNKRNRIYLPYKSGRKNKKRTPEEQEAYLDFKKQIELVKTDYLPSMGFSNVLYAKGYEADDIIASLCKSDAAMGDDVVIVSSDTDLYQLLTNTVSIYKPTQKELFTAKQFKQRYGIKPQEWVHVKALTGCHSDSIPGVPRFGEKTALSYLKGEKVSWWKKDELFTKIQKFETLRLRNIRLIKLPLPFTPRFELRPDEVTLDKWRSVAQRLGITSLPAPIPVFQGRKANG